MQYPREEVPPEGVTAYDEGSPWSLRSLDDHKVAGGRDEAQEGVLVAVSEEPYGVLDLGVDIIGLLEGAEIEVAGNVMHVGSDPPVVEPVDRLRGHVVEVLVGDLRIAA